YTVREDSSADRIWWENNQPLPAEQFAVLRRRMASYLEGRELYVQHLAAGADPRYCIGVRVVTELAWHSLFARDLLLRPTTEELAGLPIDYTIVDAPGFQADPARDGVRSATVIAINFAERLVLIGG